MFLQLKRNDLTGNQINSSKSQRNRRKLIINPLKILNNYQRINFFPENCPKTKPIKMGKFQLQAINPPQVTKR